MFKHLKVKKLISIYSDGECTAKEKELVETHVQKCAKCQKELQLLDTVSVSLQGWKDQEVTPDLESRIKEKFLRGDLKMKTYSKKKRAVVFGGISTLVVASLVVVIYTHDASLMDQRIFPEPQDGPIINVPELTVVPEPILPGPVMASRGSIAPPQPNIKAAVMAENMAMQKSSSASYAPSVAMMYDASESGGASYSYAPMSGFGGAPSGYYQDMEYDTESYDRIYESGFLTVRDEPLSTFSIDVDTAAYSNVRRYLYADEMPPVDAVRIEELINYFSYNYPQPTGTDPVSITTEIATAPWNAEHQLVQIGLQAKKIETANLPASNLVFLLDVSGSMDEPNKLPLLKKAFKMLVEQLGAQDKVSIVVYAGAAGIVLEATPGDQHAKIVEHLLYLEAGGSTAGGEGIELAYDIAKKNFIRGGNNRVILATDGDFNTGSSSEGEMTRLIEEKREDGIFLTVLGFGMGNYKDSMMESLADKGNGNAAYIDNLLEAKKVLVSELGGTLFTIAKDVKVQVEFNPSEVKAYRLIGYENRALQNQEFNDDKKDAGEMGSGHSVTVLYEIALADSKEAFPETDDLKYQKTSVVKSKELMTVKVRYKEPDGDESKLISKTVDRAEVTETPSEDFRFASSVAEFGLVLRESEFKGDASYVSTMKRARAAKGEDTNGYRAELIKLIEIAEILH